MTASFGWEYEGGLRPPSYSHEWEVGGAEDPSSSPSISGPIIAWAANPFYGYDPMQGWSVQTYDLRTGLVKTVAQGPGPQALRGVVLAGDRVAYTLSGDQQNGWWLYQAALR